MKVTHKKIYRKFSLYIDGKLHLDFKIDLYAGLQSWFEGPDSNRLYFIEIYLKEVVDPILLEYTNVKVWDRVLAEIDKYL
jgi:hypothetical protein